MTMQPHQYRMLTERDNLSADGLKELVEYDKSTGVFTWKKWVNGNSCRSGKTAGTMNVHGYVQIQIGGRIYLAHRLAFLYVTGKWPEGQIDHKDGARSNNKFSNLRDATVEVNRQNQRKARSDNKVGLLGVDKKDGRFRATIRVGGKAMHIGGFKTPELAHDAYVSAKRAHHEGCTL